MKRWLNPEREARIVELYERYENAREVAQELGISDGTVYRALKKHDIRRTHRHEDESNAKNRLKVLTSHCRSKYCPVIMVMMHEILGMSAREISEATGYNQNAVRNVLTRRGCSTDRVCGNAKECDIDEIEREYLMGVTTYELGSKYGVSPQTISKWMRKRGIKVGKGNVVAFDIERTCPRCGKRFITRHKDKVYCSRTCSYAVNSQRRDDRKRVLRYEDDIPLRVVYDSDKGKCYICGRKTDWNDYHIKNGYKICGNRYPSREHVVALSNGGTHTLNNVRLACRECNSRKGNKGQMRLAI